MLTVELTNIVGDSEVAGQISELLRRAHENKELIVITRGGKPAVAMLSIEQLESLSGHTLETAATPAPAPVMPSPTPIMPVMPTNPGTLPSPQPSPVAFDTPTPQPAISPAIPEDPSALPDMPV